MGTRLTPLIRYFERQKQLEDGTIFARTSFTEQRGLPPLVDNGQPDADAIFKRRVEVLEQTSEPEFECCGRSVVGAEHGGQQEMLCCGNPEPKGERASKMPVFVADSVLRDAGLPTYTELAKAFDRTAMCSLEPENEVERLRTRLIEAGIIE